jgi:uncharacterized protein
MAIGDTGWPYDSSPFHKGEIEAQKKIGVDKEIETFARRAVRPYMPDQHRQFFSQLPIVYVGHVDEQGWPWATALAGHPGFLTSSDPQILEVASIPSDHDPLSIGLKEGAKLGFLGLEMHSRRRNRLNATVSELSEVGFSVAVDQSFGNCPQYIQTRAFEFVPQGEKPDAPTEFTELDQFAADLIRAADTFFVSSYADHQDDEKTSGVDMSHRGGRPGFVKVDGNTLTIPDYTGNFHFNTIGNFLINPKAGLLFIDFETGDMLQLTGSVEMIWDGPEVSFFQGAERAWKFNLHKGIRLKKELPLRWKQGEMSLNSLLTGTWEEADAQRDADSRRNEWRGYKVVDIEDESSVIRSFYLQPVDDAGLLSHKAGQFLTIRTVINGDEKPLVRTYTLSSSPLDKAYRISVKRDGQMSQHLHDALRVGDVIEARAPKGRFFHDPANQRPAVLLAGGVGITPMMSMMRHALQQGFRYRRRTSVGIIHSTKNTQERAFFDEITDLVKQSDGMLRYVSLIGQVSPEEIAGVHYHGQGYITEDILRQIAPDGQPEYFLCGPSGFMQSNYNLLRAVGVADKDIYAESFGPSSLERQPDEKIKTKTADIADQARIIFSKSKTELLWRKEDGSLLDFALSHGIEAEFGCQAGNCGSCASRLTSGHIAYETEPSAVAEAGEILICCAKPAKGSEDLVIDI